MKKPLILAAGLALATVASAQKGAPGNLMEVHVPGAAPTTFNQVAGTIVGQTESLGVTDLVVDIAGTQSWDGLSDPDNTVIAVPLGVGASMTGIGWDVTIQTVGGSWLSEARMYFDGSDQDFSGLFLAPGIAVGAPGTQAFSSGGVLDLTDNGIPDIPIGADGNLYIQFWESFDDVGNAVDADWIAPSSITVRYEGGAPVVPTVGEWGMIFLGLALLGGVVFVTMRRKAVTA